MLFDTVEKKERILFNEESEVFKKVRVKTNPNLNKKQRDDLWAKMSKSEEALYEQCVAPNDVKNGNFIEKLWFAK